jgi:hypothetical protein
MKYSFVGPVEPPPGVPGMSRSQSKWRCASACASSLSGSTPLSAAAVQSLPSWRWRSSQACF